MAMVLHPHLKPKPDLLRTMKMVIIHDLCEVYAGDHWAFNPVPASKHTHEKRGLSKILRNLPPASRKEITELWLEFEERKTLSARFAYALDKLEVLLQHNEADLKFMNKKEFHFNLICAPENLMPTGLLRDMRKIVRKETLGIYKKNKVNKHLYAGAKT